MANLNQAFCDTKDGWAFYNGETRYNSNALGTKYGEPVGKGDVVGVSLDMIEGTLSFSKNSVDWGVAFTSDEFTRGSLYPAISPIYAGDTFAIKLPQPED